MVMTLTLVKWVFFLSFEEKNTGNNLISTATQLNLPNFEHKKSILENFLFVSLVFFADKLVAWHASISLAWYDDQRALFSEFWP